MTVSDRSKCCRAFPNASGCGAGTSLVGKLGPSDSAHCRSNKGSDFRKAEWLESASLLIMITLAQESPLA